MSHLAILPFVIPLSGAAVAVLLRNHRSLQAPWTLGVLLTSFAVCCLNLWTVWSTHAPLVFQMGAGAPPFGITIVADLLSSAMAVMCQLALVLGLVYALGSKDESARYPFFAPLFLMLTTGLTGGMLTGDTFNLFVFMELLVISTCVLTAISDDAHGPEAALKYFYISLFATIFLLLANGALYVGYGTLNMADLSQRIAANPERPMLWLAIASLVGTFMVKCAAVPFHMVQPDLYTSTPTAVGAVLASVAGKIGVYGLLRCSTLLFINQSEAIRGWLLLLGVAGVIVGGLAALGTHNAKRMLAYSTVAQIGFMLAGIGWGTTASIAAAVVFMFNHSLIKAAMLMLSGWLASHTSAKSASFDALQGIGRSAPAAGVLFFIGAMALAGIPPANGFISKYMTFSSGAAARQWLSLALIGSASMLTLIYVFRAFNRIWFETRSDVVQFKPGGDSLLAPAALTTLCLIFGVWAQPMTQVAGDIAAWVQSPARYVSAVLVKQ